VRWSCYQDEEKQRKKQVDQTPWVKKEKRSSNKRKERPYIDIPPEARILYPIATYQLDLAGG
jgi:hypothetical protein